MNIKLITDLSAAALMALSIGLQASAQGIAIPEKQTLNKSINLPGYNQELIGERYMTRWWKCKWIAEPSMIKDEYGVFHFRKTFELASVPEKFIIHVTGDTRYKLYINGEFVLLGPTRCDPVNWNFETLDIAPYLREGKNVIASVVWNFGQFNPDAQASLGYTEFALQGDRDEEFIVNTDDSWKCYRSTAYSCPGGFSASKRGGYYAAGAAEYVDGNDYPWGWETLDYDDSSWKKPYAGGSPGAKGTVGNTARQLVPSPIPSSCLEDIRFTRICKSEGVTLPNDVPQKEAKIVIPAGSHAKLLYDYGKLTEGYPILNFSKGTGASIRLTYTEGLYEAETGYGKGDRNNPDGKILEGLTDRIIADGGVGRSFSPLWWRCWRYVGLDIETNDEELVIDDFAGKFSAYPIARTATFNAPGDTELSKMLDTGWWTLRLCMNETYMDCPYYEQMQYFGDAHVQSMVTMYNSNDPYIVRQLIEQGRRSITSEGITSSRYPVAKFQLIPGYAIAWMNIAYDYWYMRGDDEFISRMLPTFRSIMTWYEGYLDDDMVLRGIPYWYFIDWADEYFAGSAPMAADRSSAYYEAQFLMGLKMAAEFEEAIGMKELAAKYNGLYDNILPGFVSRYWDEERGLFADTIEHKLYSQHLNSLAVLCGAAIGDKAKEVMSKVIEDKSLVQATMYFRYYVHLAMTRAGLGDRLLDNLGQWRDLMGLNLSTWAETPEPSRSDCHAWCACPSVDLYRTLLGIESAAPGFSHVRIAPSLCGLETVGGSIPHPKGSISAEYNTTYIGKNGRQVKAGKGKKVVKAKIVLPPDTDGTLIWEGQSYSLNEGENLLDL